MTPKRKIPTNPFVYVWRELLFAHPIYIESEASPEDCANAIQQRLDEPSPHWLIASKQKVTTEWRDEDHYKFHIIRRRSQNNPLMTIAYASGDIYYDEALGRTIVIGVARYGIWSYLECLVCILFLLAAMLKSEQAGIVATFILFVFAAALWELLEHRNGIVNEIEQTVRNLPAKKKK
jgi:hypothetical protein